MFLGLISSVLDRLWGLFSGQHFFSLAGGSFSRRKRMVMTLQHRLIDHWRASNAFRRKTPRRPWIATLSRRATSE
jgi:hypothetical protein